NPGLFLFMASVLVYCLPRLYRGANLWLWIYPEPTSNETGKRLAKFLCGMMTSPAGRGRKAGIKKPGYCPVFRPT
ncbi:TPA: hypothetical protein ACP4ZY_003758, partial [Enterobacter cloacae]